MDGPNRKAAPRDQGGFGKFQDQPKQHSSNINETQIERTPDDRIGTDVDEFMSTIFGDDVGGVSIVAARDFRGFKSQRYRAGFVRGEQIYVCISKVKDIPRARFLKRRVQDLVRTVCIVLDDVGTKVPVPKVEPTWALETSPGNFQYGYKLEGGADPDEAAILIDALAEGGYTDPGAKGANRLVRLPGSLNAKPQHNGWRARLTVWHPECHYTVAALASAFGVTAGAAPRTLAAAAGVPPAPQGAPSRSATSHDRKPPKSLQVAVRSLSADEYDVWIKVCLALKNDYGEQAYDLWNEWSRTSHKYPGDTEARRIWDTLTPNGTLTCATIFWMARKCAVERAEAAGELILSHKAPLESAKAFVAKCFLRDGYPIICYWQSTFYEYAGTHYVEVMPDSMRARAYRFLESAHQITTKGLIVSFDPTDRLVNALIDALKAVVQVEAAINAPAWLQGGDDYAAHDLLACSNGLLHIPTRILLPHTPMFFNLNAINLAYDATATAPRFERLLEEVFSDDHESRDTLLEEIGYFLVPDTSQQKIFLWVGAPRSGKGTLARVLTQLLGSTNVCAPTLRLLNDVNGSAVLIGKSLAILSDVRQGKGMESGTWQEKLLAISGEDWQSLGRKYKDPWQGVLSTRLLLLSNKIPTLTDASGALGGRFIVVVFRVSFYGREDPGLTTKLLVELPGILNRALDGYDRLKERGHFLQPATSAEAIEELNALGSPIKTFIDECCVVDKGESVPRDTLYERYRIWCDVEGRDFPITRATFGAELHAALPSLRSSRRRGHDGSRHRVYEGISLKAVLPNGSGPDDFRRAGLAQGDIGKWQPKGY